MTGRISPDGYWPGNMDTAASNRSLFDFGRMIYPIWRGIEEKDIAEETKRSQEEVNEPGQYIYECLTLHKQDHAIYRSHHKPNRFVTTPVKAAAGNRYGAWKGV